MSRRPPSPHASRLTQRGALRVPEITAYFWLAKALSTALGESTSDYSVHAINPYIAVILGFVAFAASLAIQFSRRRYEAWAYWLAVAMVGVFGTMCADVVHVVLGVPYAASALLYAAILAAVFIVWQRTEGTLSIHTVDSARREAFYWATVVATFAMGTAVGDFTAYTLHMGYFRSLVFFAAIVAVPAIGRHGLRWNEVFTFWFAYVVTRPLGASFADGAGKPVSFGGLGWGAGHVALGLAAVMGLVVAFLAVTRLDVQHPHRAAGGRALRRRTEYEPEAGPAGP